MQIIFSIGLIRTTFEIFAVEELVSCQCYNSTRSVAMKSFVFCVVLTCAWFCLSKVSAFENDAPSPTVGNICVKAFEYLKSKDLLASDFPLNESSSKCLSPLTIPEMFDHMRDGATKLMERRIPNGSDCAIVEFNKRQRILDLILAIRIIHFAESLTDEKRGAYLIRPTSELEQNFKEIATECDIEDDTFLLIFQGAFNN